MYWDGIDTEHALIMFLSSIIMGYNYPFLNLHPILIRNLILTDFEQANLEAISCVL